MHPPSGLHTPSTPHAHTPIAWRDQRVIVTGGAGFLGSAVVRALAARSVPPSAIAAVRSRDFDLTDPGATLRLLRERFGGGPPTLVIHCAGAVGGIQANRDQPARFFFENLAMTLNLVEAFRQAGLIDLGAALVQIGSMTSYPAGAPIPYREDDLWNGYPDPASAPYGIAKRAAWTALDAYHRQHGLRSGYVIPVNLYGPGDNIADERTAHVAGTLVRRFVDAHAARAPEVVCWGSGSPTRDFLFIDDAAEGVVRAAEHTLGGSGEPIPINLGSGREVSIKELAQTIARRAGFTGRITWDISMPDGQPRRCLDVGRAARILDWHACTPLEEGLARTVAWYRSTITG